MSEQLQQLAPVLETTARGRAVLTNPRLNRSTAFTQEQRRELDLVGLVPAQVLTLEQQAERAYQARVPERAARP